MRIFRHFCNNQRIMLLLNLYTLWYGIASFSTVKNTVISPNFLVWKYCGKVQFPHSFGHPKLCGNCAFPQNFHTRKLGEITVFFAVLPSSIIQWRKDLNCSCNFLSEMEKLHLKHNQVTSGNYLTINNHSFTFLWDIVLFIFIFKLFIFTFLFAKLLFLFFFFFETSW